MKKTIDKLSLVGVGNVGSHLHQSFIQEGISVSHVVSRSKPSDALLKQSIWVEEVEKLPANQLVIVCVPDDSIQSVLSRIPASCPVAYTSGSVELQHLSDRSELGVFYPLQTFTKGKEVNMFEVPFFIEANSTVFASELFDLAWKISRKVSFASSEDRKKLHVAAVFINNFTNHLAHISKSYLTQHNLDFEHLKPLLKETAHKLETQDPFDAQTGPARRNDQNIIEEHLRLIEDPTQRELYRLFSKSIHQTYFND